MKTCPNCGVEIETNFDVCWNCNYSLKEKHILEFADSEKKKDIRCLRCNVKLDYSGAYKFHEGAKIGFFGNLFEAFVNREKFDLYTCPKCGKVEFFISK